MKTWIDPPKKAMRTGRVLRIRQECNYPLAGGIILSTIDLFRRERGEYWALCRDVRTLGKPVTARKKLDRDRVDLLLAKLNMLKIPALPDFDHGCDGGYTEIEIGDREGKACYRWWDVPPRGWEELDRIINRFVRMAGMD